MTYSSFSFLAYFTPLQEESLFANSPFHSVLSCLLLINATMSYLFLFSTQILVYFVSMEFGKIPGIQGLFVACLFAGTLR